jgi:hypothetical protein
MTPEFSGKWKRKGIKGKLIVFWDLTPCGFCKKRRFEGIYRLHHEGGEKSAS